MVLKAMIKYPLLHVIVLSMLSMYAPAQQNSNVGIFAGTAYYMGDINPNRHFYNPSMALGVIYRYNINTRYAIRANGYYVALRGSDVDFPEILRPDRPLSPVSFNTSLIDIAMQVEFNFLPYIPNQKSWDFTPYLTTGFAAGLILKTNSDANNLISLPFGIGIKTTFTKRWSGGAEWSFRRTFSDRIDGIENPSGVSSTIHNNDWYSYLGVFITYKFFNFAVDCPAYE